MSLETDAARARALAEVRIPTALVDLYNAREHLQKTPVVYDVEGRCLYQAMDAITAAIGKVEQMEAALETRGVER